MDLEQLKYPIGHFVKPTEWSKESFDNYCDSLARFPEKLKSEVAALSEDQLNTIYRPGGWTIRQVVHHCADSHSNGIIRLKLALTEETPTIKPYREELWAELADSKTMDIEPSLSSLTAVHLRWTTILNSLPLDAMSRKFIHPQYHEECSVFEHSALYAWHGNHHLAHITSLKNRMGWK
jgi:hypothetical protein